MELGNVGNMPKLPALGSGVGNNEAVEIGKFNDVKNQSNVQQQVQSNGLANMFANTGQQVQAGRVQGQQGLAGMLGNYRGMWQPNGGNNYQIVGGVENLI